MFKKTLKKLYEENLEERQRALINSSPSSKSSQNPFEKCSVISFPSLIGE